MKGLIRVGKKDSFYIVLIGLQKSRDKGQPF